MSKDKKFVPLQESCDKPSAKITSHITKTPIGRIGKNSVDKPPARKPNVGSGDTKK